MSKTIIKLSMSVVFAVIGVWAMDASKPEYFQAISVLSFLLASMHWLFWPVEKKEPSKVDHQQKLKDRLDAEGTHARMRKTGRTSLNNRPLRGAGKHQMKQRAYYHNDSETLLDVAADVVSDSIQSSPQSHSCSPAPSYSGSSDSSYSSSSSSYGGGSSSSGGGCD